MEVVRELFNAVDAQDWEVALGVFDSEVEWSPVDGTFHGPEGVVTAMTEWLGPWDEHSIDAEEITEVGSHVLAVVHLTGRGAGSGMEVDQRFFQVYSVRGGRIVRMVEFVERGPALEAAGLSE